MVVSKVNAKEAVARRIYTLCKERKMTVNALANLCGVAPYSGREKLTFKCRAFETKFSRKR